MGHLRIMAEVHDFYKLPVSFMGVSRAGIVSKALSLPSNGSLWLQYRDFMNPDNNNLTKITHNSENPP